MKLIVISSSIAVPNEHQIINSLFEEGMEMFQLHKPNYSTEEMKQFVQQIPFKHHSRIVLHTSFPKFHSLQELEMCKERYDYAFLSPIFDSISKVGYKSKFDLNELKAKIANKNIIALGGINEDKIETCYSIGFTGVAILGAIWGNDSPIEKFKSLKALCQKKDLVF